jgi:hypothetical protein
MVIVSHTQLLWIRYVACEQNTMTMNTISLQLSMLAASNIQIITRNTTSSKQCHHFGKMVVSFHTGCPITKEPINAPAGGGEAAVIKKIRRLRPSRLCTNVLYITANGEGNVLCRTPCSLAILSTEPTHVYRCSSCHLDWWHYSNGTVYGLDQPILPHMVQHRKLHFALENMQQNASLLICPRKWEGNEHFCKDAQPIQQIVVTMRYIMCTMLYP